MSFPSCSQVHLFLLYHLPCIVAKSLCEMVIDFLLGIGPHVLHRAWFNLHVRSHRHQAGFQFDLDRRVGLHRREYVAGSHHRTDVARQAEINTVTDAAGAAAGGSTDTAESARAAQAAAVAEPGTAAVVATAGTTANTATAASTTVSGITAAAAFLLIVVVVVVIVASINGRVSIT